MQCPICRAQNDTGPQCRRCRADLSLLFSLDARRRQAITAAYEGLTQGRWAHAWAGANEANGLRRDQDSLRLLAVIHLLRRQFPEAWRAYQTCTTWKTGTGD
jgi:hypothetical protein